MPGGEARDRLLTQARAHRVDRLVAWKTKEIGDDLRAEAVLEELDVRELTRVLRGLESYGILPLVVKGAALAHTHYEESWLRPRLDIDVLIPNSQRHAIATALHDLGYTQPPFISGELVMYQVPFERVGEMGRVHTLDVHWRLANPQTLASLPDYEELWSRAVSIGVRGQCLRTLSPMDALLLACVHRAAHHDLSDELLWLYDIHLVSQRFTAEEWSDFVGLASRCRVRALCIDGLRSAERCFQTRVPEEALAGVTPTARPAEPSAVYLRRDLTRFDRLLADLRALNYDGRLRLLAEHVLPSAEYLGKKYGVRNRALLPFLYLRRLSKGVGGHLKRTRESNVLIK